MKKLTLWTMILGFSVSLLLLLSFLLNNFLYIHKPMNIDVNNSVTIYAEADNHACYGSGVVFVHSSGKTFVWTCFHVVRGNVWWEYDFLPNENKIQHRLKTSEVDVYQELFNNEPKRVGNITLHAKIVRFNSKDDIALLEISEGFWKSGVAFPYTFLYDVPVGSKIFHVGSFGGKDGENSVSEGIVGQRGFMLDDKVYDRIATGFQPGSSGGGIFESNTGLCVGLIARQINDKSHNQGYMIPYRRMVEFAKRLDCMWAIEKNEFLPEDYLDTLTDDAWKIPAEILKDIQNRK